MKTKIKVLMVGVSKATQGGMWTVANNYLTSEYYNENVKVKYIATATVGPLFKRLSYSLIKVVLATLYIIIFRPNLVHVHMSERSSVWRKGWLVDIAHKLHIVTVIHMHGADFQEWYTSLSKKRKNKVNTIFNNASKIIILGNYWRLFLKNMGIDSKKIKVIYNAVNIHNNIYNKRSKNILFLGAIIERKGVYDILQAINDIKNEIPKGWKILFYGPLPDKKFLNKIKTLNLDNCVEYLGYLSAEKFKTVFGDISFNLLPSYNEGLPMTILEAMSYGIPSITTEVAAIPELITNGSDGLLQQPGDVKTLERNIIKLIESESLRNNLSENAYKKICNDFSCDRHVKKIIELYREALED